MILEYLTIQTGGNPIKQADLDQLGNDGWGLVTISFDTAYFMRERDPMKVLTGNPVDESKRVTGTGQTKHNPKSKVK